MEGDVCVIISDSDSEERTDENHVVCNKDQHKEICRETETLMKNTSEEEKKKHGSLCEPKLPEPDVVIQGPRKSPTVLPKSAQKFHCSICSNGFSYLQLFVRHLKEHKFDQRRLISLYRCGHCYWHSSSNSLILQHHSDKHPHGALRLENGYVEAFGDEAKVNFHKSSEKKLSLSHRKHHNRSCPSPYIRASRESNLHEPEAQNPAKRRLFEGEKSGQECADLGPETADGQSVCSQPSTADRTQCIVLQQGQSPARDVSEEKRDADNNSSMGHGDEDQVMNNSNLREDICNKDEASGDDKLSVSSNAYTVNEIKEEDSITIEDSDSDEEGVNTGKSQENQLGSNLGPQDSDGVVVIADTEDEEDVELTEKDVEVVETFGLKVTKNQQDPEVIQELDLDEDDSGAETDAYEDLISEEEVTFEETCPVREEKDQAESAAVDQQGTRGDEPCSARAKEHRKASATIDIHSTRHDSGGKECEEPRSKVDVHPEDGLKVEYEEAPVDRGYEQARSVAAADILPTVNEHNVEETVDPPEGVSVHYDQGVASDQLVDDALPDLNEEEPAPLAADSVVERFHCENCLFSTSSYVKYRLHQKTADHSGVTVDTNILPVDMDRPDNTPSVVMDTNGTHNVSLTVDVPPTSVGAVKYDTTIDTKQPVLDGPVSSVRQVDTREGTDAVEVDIGGEKSATVKVESAEAGGATSDSVADHCKPYRKKRRKVKVSQWTLRMRNRQYQRDYQARQRLKKMEAERKFPTKGPKHRGRKRKLGSELDGFSEENATDHSGKAAQEEQFPTYLCEFCDFSTFYETGLHVHVTRMHSKPIACPSCHQKVTGKQGLEQHRPTCPGDGTGAPQKASRCKYCSFRSDDLKELEHHVSTLHDGQDKTKCQCCSPRFKGNPARRRGSESMTRSSEHALDLKRKRKIRKMKLPIQQGMNAQRQTIYKCSYCDLQSNYYASVLRHIKMQHFGVFPYKCMYCEQNGADKWHIELHVSTVHSDRPFKYIKLSNEEITKTIQNTPPLVATAVKTIQNTPPLVATSETAGKGITDGLYSCEWCPCKWPSMTNLVDHVSAQHFRYYPYQCGYCDFKAFSPALVRQHCSKQHRHKAIKVKSLYTSQAAKQTNNASSARHEKDGAMSDKEATGDAKAADKVSDFSLVDNLIWRVDDEPGKQYRCLCCRYTARMRFPLRQHVYVVHVRGSVFQCGHCDHRSISSYKVRAHCRHKHPDLVAVVNVVSMASIRSRELEPDRHVEQSETAVETQPEHLKKLLHASALQGNQDIKNTEDVNDLTKRQKSDTSTTRLELPRWRHKYRNRKNAAFKCPMCSYATSYKQTFTYHLMVELKFKPYHCKHCNYKAIVKKYIEAHCKTKHANLAPGDQYMYVPDEAKMTKLKTIIGHSLKGKVVSRPTGEDSETSVNMLVKKRRTDLAGTDKEKSNLVLENRSRDVKFLGLHYECRHCGFQCKKSKEFRRHAYTEVGYFPYQCVSCDFQALKISEVNEHFMSSHGKVTKSRMYTLSGGCQRDLYARANKLIDESRVISRQSSQVQASSNSPAIRDGVHHGRRHANYEHKPRELEIAADEAVVPCLNSHNSPEVNASDFGFQGDANGNNSVAVGVIHGSSNTGCVTSQGNRPADKRPEEDSGLHGPWYTQTTVQSGQGQDPSGQSHYGEQNRGCKEMPGITLGENSTGRISGAQYRTGKSILDEVCTLDVNANVNWFHPSEMRTRGTAEGYSVTMQEAQQASQQSIIAANTAAVEGRDSTLTRKCYKCTRCGRTTKQRRYFKIHAWKEFGYKPYKCTACEFCAILKGHVVNHYIQKHGKLAKKNYCVFSQDKAIESEIERYIDSSEITLNDMQLKRSAQTGDTTPQTQLLDAFPESTGLAQGRMEFPEDVFSGLDPQLAFWDKYACCADLDSEILEQNLRNFESSDGKPFLGVFGAVQEDENSGRNSQEVDMNTQSASVIMAGVVGPCGSNSNPEQHEDKTKCVSTGRTDESLGTLHEGLGQVETKLTSDKPVDEAKNKVQGKKRFECVVCKYQTDKRTVFIEHACREVGYKPYTCNMCDYKSEVAHNVIIHFRRMHDPAGNVKYQFVNDQASLEAVQRLLMMSDMSSQSPGADRLPLMADASGMQDEPHGNTQRGVASPQNQPVRAGSHLCDTSHIEPRDDAQLVDNALRCDAVSSRKVTTVTNTGLVHPGGRAGNVDESHGQNETIVAPQKGVGVPEGEMGSGKRYQCIACGYTADWKTVFMRHAYKEVGYKPFHCTSCDYKSTVIGNVIYHSRRMHGKNIGRKYRYKLVEDPHLEKAGQRLVAMSDTRLVATSDLRLKMSKKGPHGVLQSSGRAEVQGEANVSDLSQASLVRSTGLETFYSNMPLKENTISLNPGPSTEKRSAGEETRKDRSKEPEIAEESGSLTNCRPYENAVQQQEPYRKNTEGSFVRTAPKSLGFRCSVCSFRAGTQEDVRKHFELQHPRLLGVAGIFSFPVEENAIYMEQDDQTRCQDGGVRACSSHQMALDSSSQEGDVVSDLPEVQRNNHSLVAQKTPICANSSLGPLQSSTKRELTKGFRWFVVNKLNPETFKCGYCTFRATFPAEIVVHKMHRHQGKTLKILKDRKRMDRSKVIKLWNEYQQMGEDRPAVNPLKEIIRKYQGLYQCLECNAGALGRYTVMCHVLKHRTDRFLCGHGSCRFTSKFRSKLQHHALRCHGDRRLYQRLKRVDPQMLMCARQTGAADVGGVDGESHPTTPVPAATGNSSNTEWEHEVSPVGDAEKHTVTMEPSSETVPNKSNQVTLETQSKTSHSSETVPPYSYDVYRPDAPQQPSAPRFGEYGVPKYPGIQQQPRWQAQGPFPGMVDPMGPYSQHSYPNGNNNMAVSPSQGMKDARGLHSQLSYPYGDNNIIVVPPSQAQHCVPYGHRPYPPYWQTGVQYPAGSRVDQQVGQVDLQGQPPAHNLGPIYPGQMQFQQSGYPLGPQPSESYQLNMSGVQQPQIPQTVQQQVYQFSQPGVQLPQIPQRVQTNGSQEQSFHMEVDWVPTVRRNVQQILQAGVVQQQSNLETRQQMNQSVVYGQQIPHGIQQPTDYAGADGQPSSSGHSSYQVNQPLLRQYNLHTTGLRDWRVQQQHHMSGIPHQFGQQRIQQGANQPTVQGQGAQTQTYRGVQLQMCQTGVPHAVTQPGVQPQPVGPGVQQHQYRPGFPLQFNSHLAQQQPRQPGALQTPVPPGVELRPGYHPGFRAQQAPDQSERPLHLPRAQQQPGQSVGQDQAGRTPKQQGAYHQSDPSRGQDRPSLFQDGDRPVQEAHDDMYSPPLVRPDGEVTQPGQQPAKCSGGKEGPSSQYEEEFSRFLTRLGPTNKLDVRVGRPPIPDGIAGMVKRFRKFQDKEEVAPRSKLYQHLQRDDGITGLTGQDILALWKTRRQSTGAECGVKKAMVTAEDRTIAITTRDDLTLTGPVTTKPAESDCRVSVSSQDCQTSPMSNQDTNLNDTNELSSEGTPGPPSGQLRVVSISPTVLSFSWEQAVYDGGSPVLHYILEKHDISCLDWQQAGVTEPDNRTLCLSDLDDNQLYFFRVLAENACGRGTCLELDRPVVPGMLFASKSQLKVADAYSDQSGSNQFSSEVHQEDEGISTDSETALPLATASEATPADSCIAIPLSTNSAVPPSNFEIALPLATNQEARPTDSETLLPLATDSEKQTSVPGDCDVTKRHQRTKTFQRTVSQFMNCIIIKELLQGPVCPAEGSSNPSPSQNKSSTSLVIPGTVKSRVGDVIRRKVHDAKVRDEHDGSIHGEIFNVDQELHTQSWNFEQEIKSEESSTRGTPVLDERLQDSMQTPSHKSPMNCLRPDQTETNNQTDGLQSEKDNIAGSTHLKDDLPHSAENDDLEKRGLDTDLAEKATCENSAPKSLNVESNISSYAENKCFDTHDIEGKEDSERGVSNTRAADREHEEGRASQEEGDMGNFCAQSGDSSNGYENREASEVSAAPSGDRVSSENTTGVVAGEDGPDTDVDTRIGNAGTENEKLATSPETVALGGCPRGGDLKNDKLATSSCETEPPGGTSCINGTNNVLEERNTENIFANVCDTEIAEDKPSQTGDRSPNIDVVKMDVLERSEQHPCEMPSTINTAEGNVVSLGEGKTVPSGGSNMVSHQVNHMGSDVEDTVHPDGDKTVFCHGDSAVPPGGNNRSSLQGDSNGNSTVPSDDNALPRHSDSALPCNDQSTMPSGGDITVFMGGRSEVTSSGTISLHQDNSAVQPAVDLAELPHVRKPIPFDHTYTVPLNGGDTVHPKGQHVVPCDHIYAAPPCVDITVPLGDGCLSTDCIDQGTSPYNSPEHSDYDTETGSESGEDLG